MKVGIFALMAAFLIALPMTAMAGPVCVDTADDDGDGLRNCEDSCTQIDNTGSNSCDTDLDGYGNPCDGDFDNGGTVNSGDFTGIFLVDFGIGSDQGTGTDMDCGGTLNSGDFTGGFLPAFSLGSPGPSGLACAGTVACP
jgi:hypothetical protein